ncbi:phenylalanine--tRNA ligase alpha subunit [Bacillus rossius redtenbacheri]|uniref:phenylalanine--tRNA ligase alpha subunit n=1 Tax=Bacillus rossius redtenbacheri TaxID=93214 RepID=UPI002FDD75DD
MASDVCEKVLQYLDKTPSVSTVDLANYIKEDHQTVVGAVKSLQSLGDLITAEPQSWKVWELTDEGRLVADKGSYEFHVFSAIPPDSGIPQEELMRTVDNFKVGFSKAMSSGWVRVDKTGGRPVVLRKVDAAEDSVGQDLRHIRDGLGGQVAENFKQEYKRRRLLQQTVKKSYLLGRGANFSTSVTKPETELTPEMIATGSWRQKVFKPYNLDAMGVAPEGGHLHPLLKVRAQFRQIFLEMGFSEMPTNNFVENSFWNFDALFQPQQHPARDAHDTFFLCDPARSTRLPEDYVERVRRVHSTGGHGSRGYGYDWKLAEAQKNLLRTHTTAVSARMLYRLAQQPQFRPVKYFSIDRVFRNETLDATHLAEFHQVEGLVVDYKLTLGDLIGLLYEFFGKLGIERLNFKPAYNPYTEPSMEIFSYHDGLGRWMEVGNSGMFRPEMLLPMGLPEGVTAIAWGLSLERPTMIKYKLNNIRDLVGPKVDLQMVHDSPICRLDKHGGEAGALRELERRWDHIHASLEELAARVAALRVSPGPEDLHLAITANPSHPPFSLRVLLRLLSLAGPVACTEHRHSSLRAAAPAPAGFPGVEPRDGPGRLHVAFIWKDEGVDPTLVVAPVGHTNVVGEVNVARHLARLLERRPGPAAAPYEGRGAAWAAQADAWLDRAYDVTHGGPRERAEVVALARSTLSTREWLLGPAVSLADVCLWSALRQDDVAGTLPRELRRWLDKCSRHPVFSHSAS